MPEPRGPKLADAIDDLRRELSDAVARGEGERLRFQLGSVTMEFEVELAQSTEGEVGVRFWVVSVGGSASRTGTTSHRISLELTPLLDGASPLISDVVEDDDPPYGDDRGE